MYQEGRKLSLETREKHSKLSQAIPARSAQRAGEEPEGQCSSFFNVPTLPS